VTLTTFGSKLVREGWKQRGWDEIQLLGREEKKVRRYNPKKRYFFTQKETPFIEDIYFEIDFVTETYHGGRNEQFLFGICDEGIWRDHDLSSAYTTAMSLIKKPNWSEAHRIDDIEQMEMLDLAFAKVEFEFPDSVRFPTLPVRSPNGILFPRTGTSCCAAPEIALARSLGANLKLKRGLKVPIESNDSVFSDFITGCINKRGEHEKGTFKNQFWKEVGNSTYGKTAQGLRKKRVYDLRADDMVELPESKLTQPFFASFITSYTRAVLGEILNRFPETVQVFSVTTDGFLSNATDTDIEHATNGPLFQSFKAGRQNLVEDDQVLEVKHTIKQPLGWRTRGSATLKTGDDSKDNIVLQKGGIKSAADLTVEEENARVVRLFFNREPGQTQNYTSAVGLKDLIRYGSDFIFRSVTKRLSMEFDWKRMPVDPVDQTIEFESEQFTHLSFATKPLENLKQFQSIRDAWEKWGDKPPRVIKSVSDLSDFLTYLSVGRKSNESASKYLSRQGDADIKRLRRDLTLAFRNHQAGFAKIRRTYIPQRQFAEILEAAGIGCKKTDVENARGKFKPYQTPPSDRVKTALSKLQKIWPELESDLFLVQQTQMNSLPPEPLSQALV
ncbi:MAG: hypothetical protein KF874_10395, partial [Rhizobiaceae bacterium]|nr:hypothetical protein [Rhizobiaceae bacterium]